MNKLTTVAVALTISISLAACSKEPTDADSNKSSAAHSIPRPEASAAPVSDALADASEGAPLSALVGAIEEADYPAPTSESQFDHCFERSSGDAEFVTCDAIPVDECPYSTDGSCEVFAEFRNGAIRYVNYDYTYDNYSGDSLFSYLNDRYGQARSVKEDGRPIIDLTRWLRTWSDQRVEITIMRSKGTNINGVPYDEVAVMFVDKKLPPE